MATGTYSLSIFDEEMFNNKTPAFLFSTGQEEKQSHKPREWMCFGVCFVVVLGYKERLSASVLNVGPFRRSHLVCFRRSTAPALRYSLMIVPSVSPTWKAQSNGQWRFIVFVIACFFRTLSTVLFKVKYIHINELHNEYIPLNACKK